MSMTTDEVTQQYHDATDAYSSGDFRRAGELFSALLIEPNGVAYSNDLHWNYAMCLAHLGDWPTAMEHVRASGYQESDFRESMRQSNVRDAEHDYREADQLYQQQRWSEAAAAFVELMVHPGLGSDVLAPMHWNVAMCLAHLGDYSTALEHIRASGYQESDFRQAMRSSNTDFARHEYQQAVAMYEAQQWSQAGDAFAELMFSPGVDASSMPGLHWNLGMCLAHLGEWDTAFGHVRAGHHDEQEFIRAVTASGLTPPQQ
jgi:tetratricopeptide (TPR) repeat protein